MGDAGAGRERQWSLPKVEQSAVACLMEGLDCPRIVAELLVSRGIADLEKAKDFLEPELAQLGDPLAMKGMAETVARIRVAVRLGEPILIYGDYDVDGTTATVLLKTAIERIALPELPAKVTWHVPHRLREGYGMQANVLGRAAAAGVRLVISVDTGIRAFQAAAEAKALGLDLIVTDHHLPDGVVGVPEAMAVVNPAQEGCGYGFKSLCGAGVAFQLSHALLAAVADTPEQRARLKGVLLPSFLKLVAIATIADSVPLVGENRVIAALGLAALKNPVQPGLRALMEVAKLALDEAPTATEVGFRLAPRINAAGRMDVADEVIELFLTRDVARARVLAEKLDRLNAERRTTEAAALAEIELQVLALRGEDGECPPECVILDDAAWHRGVLGILASRVVERTGRPVLIVTHEVDADGLEESQAHGSGRSVAGFHLLDALTAVDGGAARDPIFNRFGGHAHAVGFSLPSRHMASLRQRMGEHAASRLTGAVLCPDLQVDAEVTLAEITPELWRWLGRCGPFGNGHPEPVFVARDVVLTGPVRFIQEKHVCLEVTQGERRERFSALGWSRTVDWVARCAQLELGAGSRLDLAFRITEKRHERYGGLQLELQELRLT